MTDLMSGPSPNRRSVLARRIRWFVTATIVYNLIEAVVALSAGATASSSALIGFGLDSLIEVSSAAAVAWQFAGTDPVAREKVALRCIAFSFFALAAFVTVTALRSLLGGVEADHSTVGLILAAVSLAVMPALSYGQRRAGRELGSRSAVADSKQTLLCTYLSAILLVGLGLNWLWGWTWADPVAALVIAGVAVREGVAAWRGDVCCTPTSALDDQLEEDGCGCAGGCSDACCQAAAETAGSAPPDRPPHRYGPCQPSTRRARDCPALICLPCAPMPPQAESCGGRRTGAGGRCRVVIGSAEVEGVLRLPVADGDPRVQDRSSLPVDPRKRVIRWGSDRLG